MEDINIVIPEKAIEILEPAGNVVIEIFTDAWTYVFGPIQYLFKKKNYKRKKEYELFCDKVDDEFAKISPDNISNPPINIIGPTIEASKWYFYEKDIRVMFAKLIAKSFDNTQIPLIQPSFVEIIKQLTPLDAKILKSIYIEGNKSIIRGHLTKIHSDGQLETCKSTSNLYLFDDCRDINHINISLDNLIRLNLISLTYDEQFKNKNMYKNLEKAYNDKFNFYFLSEYPNFKSYGYEVSINYGRIVTTSFGFAFASICIE